MLHTLIVSCLVTNVSVSFAVRVSLVLQSVTDLGSHSWRGPVKTQVTVSKLTSRSNLSTERLRIVSKILTTVYSGVCILHILIDGATQLNNILVYYI